MNRTYFVTQNQRTKHILGINHVEKLLFLKFALMKRNHIPKIHHHTTFKYNIIKVVQIIVRIIMPRTTKQ